MRHPVSSPPPRSEDRVVIPDSCQERFLSLSAEARQVLLKNNLRGGGISHLSRPYEIERWNLLEPVLLFTLRGQGVLCHGLPEPRVLRPGDLAILPAQRHHCYRANGKWSLLWFHLSPGPAWPSLVAKDCWVQPARFQKNLLRLAEDFLDETTSGRPLATQVLDALSALMVLFIKRELSASPTPELIGRHRRIEAVWQEVMDHPEEAWSVSKVGSRAGFSRTRLHHFCKATYGISPYEKLTELRMSKARYYLENTDWTLADISERVGYETAFAFSRAFKRYSGISPGRLPGRSGLLRSMGR